jgi:hypothetical protein
MPLTNYKPRRCAGPVAEDRRALVSHIFNGGTPKEFALNNGLSVHYIHRTLNRLGFSAVILSAEERAQLAILRATGGAVL